MNKDKITLVRLYSPNEHDFHHQRSDGTTYVVQIRKNRVNSTYTPEHQLNLFDINNEI
tara:strand:+ start:147 stop:320 length:174 start_codon:yes stop_codon:yes gene_type:complete